MKRCPSCGTQYTDDSLKFCLQDGTPLDDLGTTSRGDETETVISSRVRERETPPTWISPERSRTEPRHSSRTALIIALTAVLTLFVLIVVGAGIWFLSNRSGDPDNGKVNVAKPENAVLTANGKPTPSPMFTNSPNPSPSPTPNIDRAAITKAVTDQIASWEENTENFDADALMNNYADRVDYFRTSGASRQHVWQDKQRALSRYDSIILDISDMKITIDPSGETATAEFDKAWNFEGDPPSQGRVRSQLKFKNIGGRWLIVSEKDLKVY